MFSQQETTISESVNFYYIKVASEYIIFSPDEPGYSVDDADSVAYSISFVTPPILGPVLLLGGIGVIDASDSDIKRNGVVESTKYNGSATVPYLGAVIIF